MRRYRNINMIVIVAILVVSVLPMLLFMNRLQVTKYSIPAICFLAVHLVYGLIAYIFQNKGNFLRFSMYFICNIDFFLFCKEDKEYTFTKEYEKEFDQMLATYYSVVPMYAPCIFLSSAPTVMFVPLIVFALPQVLFIIKEARKKTSYVKERIRMEKQKRDVIEQQRIEQERRESMGKWK